LLDAGSSLRAGRDAADGIAGSSPKAKVILMVGSQEQKQLNHQARSSSEYQYLIKAAFARNLLYLLEKSD